MFEQLSQQPDDPILALLQEARQDRSPHVVDLSVGIYKTEDGDTPVLSAIKQAEQRRIAGEATKAYTGIRGDDRFNALLVELILGENHPVVRDRRVSSIQTIGGSGALFVGGRLLVEANADARIWAGNPTWGNHLPLLSSAGVKMDTLPYYDFATHQVDFQNLLQHATALEEGAVVLLHGCCHNPCGADLSKQQWDELSEVILARNLIPFIDVAYHGLAANLEEDAYGWRMLAAKVPEMLLAYSCSKNFGVYRDRAGVLVAISANAEEAKKTESNMMSISRATYSMPAAHGAFAVAEVLDDTSLRAAWEAELAAMNTRIDGARRDFVVAARNQSQALNFDFVADQFGMFSFLGISVEQVRALKQQHSVYMLESSRINVAGLTKTNIDYVANALGEVVGSVLSFFNG